MDAKDGVGPEGYTCHLCIGTEAKQTHTICKLAPLQGREGDGGGERREARKSGAKKLLTNATMNVRAARWTRETARNKKKPTQGEKELEGEMMPHG